MKKTMKKLIVATFVLVVMTASPLIASSFPVTTDSRIKTIVYNENEVYQLKFHSGFQSFIEFSEDEEIEIISLGEAFPWRITPVGQRLFVRPLQVNVKTNMTVITTQRTYQFEISADVYDGRADEELVYSVRFYYPNNHQKIPSMSRVGEESNLVSEPVATPGLPNTEKNASKGFALKNEKRGNVLNFNYSVAGAADEITPLKVFDDGISTYFKFPDNNLIVPSIQAVDLSGEETPLNYHMDGEYVAVNTVEVQFTLRLGKNLLCIFNNSTM